jgi:hypothetical protein
MPLPPSRQHSIARSGRIVSHARPSDGSAQPQGARGSRAPAIENPFASFYESRRKLSVDDERAETSDPSNSITRAYIVPEALLALARGGREAARPSASDAIGASSPVSAAGSPKMSPLPNIAATDRADVATESTRMFRFRSPSAGFAADWRSMQRVALSMVGWLRRACRRSIPN